MKAYPDAGEGVAWWDSESDEDGCGVPRRSDPEALRRRAKSRATARTRRYCKANGLYRLLTLTFAEPAWSRSGALGSGRAFVRRLRASGLLGDRFPYVLVAEQHKSGAWHLHLGLPRFVAHRDLEALWGLGFVDIRRLTRGDRFDVKAAAAAAAKYLAKYVGKTYEGQAEDEGRRAGEHRYEVGEGFSPLEVEASAEDEAGVWELVRQLGGIEFVWSSEAHDDWLGPPTRVFFLSDA